MDEYELVLEDIFGTEEAPITDPARQLGPGGAAKYALDKMRSDPELRHKVEGEWQARGLDPGQLEAALKPKPNGAGGAQPSGVKPTIKPNSEITPSNVKWAWYPYLPIGMITLLAGRGGAGKGLVCASLAASLKAGVWPDGSLCEQTGGILWVEAEDPIKEVITPRMIASEVDRDKLYTVTLKEYHDILQYDLYKWLKEHDIRLIVLSPLLSCLSGLVNVLMPAGTKFDKNDELQVRAVLDPLQNAAYKNDAAIVAICHLTKKSDLVAIERVLGSVAFTNFVRCVWLVAPEKDEGSQQEQGDVFRLVHAKHNLSVRGKDLLYIPEHVGEDRRTQYVTLNWSGAENNSDVDTLFDRKKDKDKKSSAGDWLFKYLCDNGVTDANKAIDDGKAVGYRESALRQAKNRDPRIHHEKLGFPARAQWYV